jgi:hypothetical protein
MEKKQLLTEKQTSEIRRKKMQKEFMTEKQVSVMTSIPLQTLRNWRYLRKGFSYHKLGRSIRYDLDDVLDYILGTKIYIKEC